MGYKTKCKDCGKHKAISPRGICLDCATIRLKKSMQEMKDHKGPTFNKWRRNLLRKLESLEPITEGKQCPKCMQLNELKAKKCKVCKFAFIDYSKAL